MLDIVKGWFDFISKYPELLAIALGTAGAQVIGLIIERYYIPTNWPVRHQKQVIVPVIIFSAWLMSVALWQLLDPTESAWERVVVCFPASLVAWLVYPPIGAWMTKKFPQVASAWADRETHCGHGEGEGG